MIRLLKQTLLTCAPICWLPADTLAQSSSSVRSPDKRIAGKIRIGDRIRYDVLLDGRMLLQCATLSINIDQKTLGVERKVKAAKEGSHGETVEPAVRQKAARIRENYNE